MDHKCNSIRTRRAFSLLSENLPVFISKLKRSPKSVRLIDPNLRKWGIIQEKNRNYFAEPLIGTPARFHSRNLSALWRISSRAGWKCRVGFRSANGGYDNGGGAPSNPYRPRKRARRGAIIRDFRAPLNPGRQELEHPIGNRAGIIRRLKMISTRKLETLDWPKRYAISHRRGNALYHFAADVEFLPRYPIFA